MHALWMTLLVSTDIETSMGHTFTSFILLITSIFVACTLRQDFKNNIDLTRFLILALKTALVYYVSLHIIIALSLLLQH